MKQFLKRLLVTLIAGGTAAVLLPPGAYSAPSTGIDTGLIMNLIWLGRADSALAVLDTYQQQQPDDPLALVLRARAMRDRLPDEDADKNLIKVDTRPIHALLDRAIDLCDSALDAPSPDPAYFHYRGRAELAKAQLSTITRSYWHAGRSASRAKKDLERYLKRVPGDPDAEGALGGFLYFADTLPGIVRFLSKLFFIPGGDRERGLEMLHFAARSGSDFSPDYEGAIAAIYTVFEGQLERGTDETIEIIARHPDYTRLVEPLGILAPFYPLRLPQLRRITGRGLARHLARGSRFVDWSLVKRVQLHDHFIEMFFGSPRRASYGFTSLIENPPARPDWVLPLALLNRGMLQARSGEKERARRAFQRVYDDKAMAFFHDTARKLLNSLDEPIEPVPLEDLEFIRLIYAGRVGEATAQLDDYKRRHSEDIVYAFYSGDLSLVRRDFEAAARWYASALDRHVPAIDETYQTLAALRLAEIHGHENRFAEAREYFDRAAGYTHAGYLFDFILRARKRYYGLLEDGTINALPSMLLYEQPASTIYSPTESRH